MFVNKCKFQSLLAIIAVALFQSQFVQAAEQLPDAAPAKVEEAADSPVDFKPTVSAEVANQINYVLDQREAREAEQKRFARSVPQDVFMSKDGPNLILIAGLDYSTSEAIDEELFEDTNYFLQLYGKEYFCEYFSLGFSMDFRQSYTATNTPVGKPDSDDIVKADAFGLSIHPKFILPFSYFSERSEDINRSIFVRADIGGVMMQSNKEDIDEEFNSELALMFGFENQKDKVYLQMEGGYGKFKRLPDDQSRSVARLVLGYDLPKSGMVALSGELNGVEKSDTAEARVQISYYMEPSVLFEAIGGLFTGE